MGLRGIHPLCSVEFRVECRSKCWQGRETWNKVYVLELIRLEFSALPLN
jgi:predicted metallopeptidase